MKKILVTGAAGFIGSHVVKACLERGYDVHALHLPNDNMVNLRQVQTSPGLRLFAGDVTREADIEQAMKGCAAVIHLAAVYALWLPDMRAMRRVNVQGTANILAVAARLGIERVVITSSIARFGGQGLDRQANETSAFALARTRNTYAITKAEAHELARAASKHQDVLLCAPTGPIGPGDYGPTPTGRLIIAAATLPVMFSPPTVSNFGDVRDIALGHLLALEKGRRGESYLLGHRDLSARQLAEMAQAVQGVSRPFVDVPFALAKFAGRGMRLFAEHVSRHAPLITDDSVAIAELGLAADCEKAVSELGLPQTPIETAMRDALSWFEEHGYMDRQKVLRQLIGLRA